MYELSVAFKYLLPRRRQLSVSIISLISIFVISLVVWLILVFFSVTNGLEKIWVGKMISLTAPLRIIPTEDYYRSYYYQIDGMSAASGYQLKSLGEKKIAAGDPYDPSRDEELPPDFPAKEVHADGSSKDLVKEVWAALEGLKASDFQMTVANLKLQLADTHQTLSQAAYIGTFDPESPITYLPEGASFKSLPKHPRLGDAILLPKSFLEAGVKVGTRGTLSFYAPTPSTVQEQRVPVHVLGFYDPGIIPVGGKFILASPELTGLIRSAHNQEDSILSQGINIRPDQLADVDKVKHQLEKNFAENGLSRYFKVETYREYDFTKDLIQQLGSEKNLFSLISMVIIIVACSNIISMLIILVNDKKMEIGILRSMGASSFSIGLIFGLAGTIMGLIGSLLGIATAYFTLQNLNALINLISRLQGFELFNPLFFGNEMPNDISGEALSFVLLATLLISMLSGIIPAIKASRLQPSQILRSE